MRARLQQMSTYMLGKPVLCNRSASYLFKSAFHCFLFFYFFFELQEFNFSSESSNPASPLLSKQEKMLRQNDRNLRHEPERYDTRCQNPDASMNLFSNASLLPFSPSVQWVGPQRHVQVQRGEVRRLVHVRQQLVHVHVRSGSARLCSQIL